MRRFFLAAAILGIVAGGPLQALAGDREIAEQIISKLKVQRDAGSLKDFTLDLKVDKGVVLLRGTVREPGQKQSVLSIANGIDGIANVIDEITVTPAVANDLPAAPTATVVRPKAQLAAAPAIVAPAIAAPAIAAPAIATAPTVTRDSFSFKQALAKANPQPEATATSKRAAAWQPLGGVAMAAATESTVESDRNITSSVVGALGVAQRQGRLKGFGVDVNTQDGRVYLNGRASSESHRELITQLVRETPGVVDVIDEIAVYDSSSVQPMPMTEQGSNEPMPLADYAPNLTPVMVDPLPSSGRSGTPAMAVSTRQAVPAQMAPYMMNQGGVQAMPAGMPMQGAMGSPMPMAPYAGGAAAPRYEQPYLPNYAWPGYAAYPNYAAVTYPQQYSPSAWPYIGPFYPYPQVPLGWRRVSLEWDDGWWFLDFTDR